MAEDDDKISEEELNGPQLVYEIVAARITARIESGEWRPGRRLPPERELAETFGVAYMTVRRAMGKLREGGVVVTVHGRGTFVADPESSE